MKKTIVLDQENVAKARRIFNVKTDKEAVNKALELAVVDDEIIMTHKAIAGKGEIERIF